MNCHDVHPLLGVYVLGKADPDDRATVERHLPTCAQCREELAELEGLPALLARVAPPEPAPSQRPRPQPVPVTPSPDLLTRLLTAAAATRARR
ncbi:MAG TPA: zf-HC2 domain-containing protein, partial [Intrasporangium sp.]|uniref:anti-sigma factor family protein n=1 Tax=Intrasporangium sp. TaxID=1925024 RepID=UPI002F928D76